MAISGQPSPPTGLSVDANGYTNQIDLSWTNGTEYTSIYIKHSQHGEEYSTLATLSLGTTSYEHTDVTTNVLHHYRVYGYSDLYEIPLSDPSNSASTACWADAVTDEVVVDESTVEYTTGGTTVDTVSDTVYLSDFGIDATDIITNYAYYVATADGKVYEYSGYYKSDGGTAITARWESKDTDFADQSIEYSDKFKIVEFVRLHYIDKSTGARISIKVSTDGGATWTTKTKSIGTGDGKGKTKDFHFITTGQIFRLAVESISATDEFQWSGLEIFFSVGGDYFEVA